MDMVAEVGGNIQHLSEDVRIARFQAVVAQGPRRHVPRQAEDSDRLDREGEANQKAREWADCGTHGVNVEIAGLADLHAVVSMRVRDGDDEGLVMVRVHRMWQEGSRGDIECIPTETFQSWMVRQVEARLEPIRR